MKTAKFRELLHKKCGGGIIAVRDTSNFVHFACSRCAEVWDAALMKPAAEWAPIKPNTGTIIRKEAADERTT